MFNEIKTKNYLELRESFQKRIFILILLVLIGIICIYFTSYEKPSDNLETELKARFFLNRVGWLHILFGVVYFSGRVIIRIDYKNNIIHYTTILRNIFSLKVKIPFSEVSHIYIATEGGRNYGTESYYYIVKIVCSDRNDVVVCKSQNIAFVNKLSRTLADSIGCRIYG